jgi:hypothetical protein
MSQPVGFTETPVYTLSAGQTATLSTWWLGVIGTLGVGYRHAVTLTDDNSRDTGVGYGNEWTGRSGSDPNQYIANIDITNTSDATVAYQAPLMALPYQGGQTGGVSFVESAIFTVAPGSPVLISCAWDLMQPGYWWRAAVSLIEGGGGVAAGGVSYGNEWVGLGLSGEFFVNIDVTNTSTILNNVLGFRTNYIQLPFIPIAPGFTPVGTVGVGGNFPSTVFTLAPSPFVDGQYQPTIFSWTLQGVGKWFRYGIFITDENAPGVGLNYVNEWTGYDVEEAYEANIDLINKSNDIVSYGATLIVVPD